MTWEDAKKRCPPGVVPACHNAKDSVTISGPKDLVKEFVQQLQDEGVFARDVNTSGVAFHSYLLEPCGAALKEALEMVLFIYKNNIPNGNLINLDILLC